jgi:peptidoglycan/xylan/chitin deacetylase (PgdA/CDA1 family)
MTTYRALAAVVLVSACAAPDGVGDRSARIEGATTVVSLTFDDTLADSFPVGDMVAARDMRATFYVNSTRFGQTNYMTLAQVRALAAQGHEIGGHTLTHARLTEVSTDEARNQVCNDRVALLDAGFSVTSFAYPFGANNTTVEQIVAECGYNSARDVGGLVTPGSCNGCPYANPVPPANLYAVRTNDSVDTQTTLAEIQQYITQAEDRGGGFVPLVFHHVCNGCSTDAITPAMLGQLLDWLAARGPATQVGTMQEIIGGDVRPPVPFPSEPPPPPPSGNLVKNPSLETDADRNAVPDCWTRGGFGTNTSSYALVNDAQDGSVAQRITISSFSSGGRRLVTAQDSGACAPPVTAGRRYTMTAYYKSTTQPRFTVYVRGTNGAWRWFAETPLLPTSTSYRQTTFTTPVMPSDATAISIGLGIFGVGTITMDNYTLADSAAPPADTTPPSRAIACNGAACASTAYSSAVTVTLPASDAGSGLREVRYTTNGSDPVNGTLYTSAFTVSASATVRATAVDNAGNRTNQTAAITITAAPPPDTTPPALSILCDGTACGTTAYPSAVTVTLPASDTGSGLREVRYTTDGSSPNSGTLYTGAFTVSASATVRATAVDNAGNRTSQTTTISISTPPNDTTPPALSIECNGAPCETTAYTAAVTVTLAASDSGSGLGEVRYTTDGSDPTNGTVYTAAFSVSASATVRATAVDIAGNRTNQSAAITIESGSSDTTPPTLAITCNGAACATTPYTSAVTVAISATDTESGVAEIRYTTDGSDPATGTVYTAAFSVSASATVRATSVDVAGNRANQSAAITIATQPPPPTNLLQNASLELDSDRNGIPDCWKRDGYGTNTATYTLVSDAFDGSVAQRLDITSFTSGGRRLASAQDAGACAPAATAGRRYTISVAYKSNIQPRFTVFYRTSSGSWAWLAESPALPTSTSYRTATYTSPALPAGATHISIGLSIFAAGSLTSDAYNLVEAP